MKWHRYVKNTQKYIIIFNLNSWQPCILYRCIVIYLYIYYLVYLAYAIWNFMPTTTHRYIHFMTDTVTFGQVYPSWILIDPQGYEKDTPHPFMRCTIMLHQLLVMCVFCAMIPILLLFWTDFYIIQLYWSFCNGA